MIVPSIDILGGQAVQLVGGEDVALEAGDPRSLMSKFAIVGEVAVIDIDAARGEGDNSALIAEMCSMGRVRVGGGVRDVPTAKRWLDSGAAKVIVGTAATPELIRQLPRDRVIVALDIQDGQIATHGWRQTSASGLEEGIEKFRDLCDGFLVTIIEKEGRLEGTDIQRAATAIDHARPARVTIAGGITTEQEISEIDRLGGDAQVGMALYTGRLDLSAALTAPMVSDREDGLWPTVVTDRRGSALGLAWSNQESVRAAIETGRGVYHSRSRGLWMKGETSGATQRLLAIDADCDRDALRFTVEQSGSGFCHLNNTNCWGPDRGLGRLERRIRDIQARSPADSNTARILRDRALLAAKLSEEAAELVNAFDPDDVASEAADLIYFALVKATSAGVDLAAIEAILDDRELRVTRRPMTAKGEWR